MERFLRKKYCDNDDLFLTMLTRVENIDYPTNDEISEKQVTTFCKKNKCQQIMDNVPVQEYMKLGIFLKGLKKNTLSYLINVLSQVCKEEDAPEKCSEDSSSESSSSESSSSEDSPSEDSSSDDSTSEEKEFEEWKHKFQTALDVFQTLEELTKISEKLVFVVCRLRRVVEDAHMTKTLDELYDVKLNYSKEPFDLYMNAREALDRALRFQDVVYYVQKAETEKKERKKEKFDAYGEHDRVGNS
eukprot:g347.t1